MDNKPICYVPERVIPEIYSGTPTFLGLPKIDTVDELKNYDVAFMGAPWEGPCTWGPFSGCELATKTIRTASARYAGYLADMDMDIFDYFTGGDYGDTAVHSGNDLETFSYIEKKVDEIIQNGAFPVTFGGDHSVSYPLIKALAKKHNGNIGIIHFDAHMDNMKSFGEELYARCSPLHRLYEVEGIDPKNIVHIGIRGPRNNPDGIKVAREKGASIITTTEIKLEGFQKAVKKAIEIAKDGTEAVYVTVCSDILDVAFNPGGPPDPCGLSSFELSMMLHECGKAGVDGFDYVEIYPSKDPGNASSHTAVWMTLYLLSGVVKNRFNLE